MGIIEYINQKYDDQYLEIALGEYMRFNQTKEHDEQYKYETLSELNRVIGGMTIDQDTV
jgi:hypothetical protein